MGNWMCKEKAQASETGKWGGENSNQENIEQQSKDKMVIDIPLNNTTF